MIDPTAAAKILVVVVEKLVELKEEKEKLDVKSSITNEDLTRRIQTLDSFQRALRNGDYDGLQEIDQKIWREKNKSVEESVAKALKWIEDRNSSIWKWWKSKSQSEELDNLLKQVNSALDDFDQFLQNTLKIQDHKLNQENNQIHQRTEGHLQKLVSHFTGKVIQIL